ncbi:sporulation protein [Saccharopolyspora cebuensis]|uniref:Sporulation protein n=1 Tax=Saccharopolyspora cebuensis TaxID=418759 RepID=A0ABV4CNB4_9PSEU
MVFKKLLGALGIGGPSVDTVLHQDHVRPGGTVTGEVRIEGGSQDVVIERVALGLVTRVETEHGDREGSAGVEFHQVDVSGRLELAASESRVLPFELAVPWETPVTAVFGQPMPGMTLGVRTELAVAKAVDKGDLDPLLVEPLPAQQRVLDAFGELGFQFKGADLEHGVLHGVAQRLPFFQEIEFFPPEQHAGRINEVELTFVAGAEGLTVVLEADKRGGFLSSGQDVFGRYEFSHQDALEADWTRLVADWLEQVAQRRGGMFGGHDGHHDHHGHDGHRGPGMGGVVAGAALGAGAGIVGGMLIGEAVEEVFEGEEDEG